LSEGLIGLALFDSCVSVSAKKKMVNAMQNKASEKQDPNYCKRISVALHLFKKKNLEDFVTEKSLTRSMRMWYTYHVFPC